MADLRTKLPNSQHRNASDTPVVLGVSPWRTPYQLWQHKLGLVEPEVTPAMLHGT